jgi:hypothetical protein
VAETTQRTLPIALRALVPARLHHPHVTEREVESNRIAGIDRAQ